MIAIEREARPGTLAGWWADRPLSTKALIVIALPLLIFLGSVASLARMGEAEERAREAVRVTIAIQTDVHEVHALVAEATAGTRGYLLTGDARRLGAYREAEASLPVVLTRLRALVRDAEARRHLDRITVLADVSRRELGEAIAAGPVEGRRSAGAGAERTADALRAAIAALQRRERVLLAERQARADAVRRRALVVTAVAYAAGIGGSLVAVLLLSSGIVRRVRALREAAARLGRGEPLPMIADARDEVGELAARMVEASTLLRQREQALRESEERFRLVIEGVRDYGIFALDADGRVASWNAGAERIKGWRADEIIGHHFSCFYPDDDRPHRPDHNLAQARRDGRVEDAGWRVRKDGTRFFADVVITALRDESGVLRGYSKVTRDITERRLAEQAVETARREAEAASAAKSLFLSRMSHELRTPLNAILGFGQLLQLDPRPRPADEREAVARILDAGRHLLSLIDEVLDIGLIERGDFELVPDVVPLADVVTEAVALTQPQARDAQVCVQATVDPTLAVHADRRRLLQVLLNLCANAIKYNRAGGHVMLHATREDARVTLTVIDDGIGVEPALADRLFQPFERLGAAARERPGTGLGLALSRTLVRAMGGDLRYAPRDDGMHGATFTLTLPFAPATRPSALSLVAAEPSA